MPYAVTRYGAVADNSRRLPFAHERAIETSADGWTWLQFIYTMNRVGKVVPPKRIILRDISLSFFPGAKIGVFGLNGSGKSTLLKIMSGPTPTSKARRALNPALK